MSMRVAGSRCNYASREFIGMWTKFKIGHFGGAFTATNAADALT